MSKFFDFLLQLLGQFAGGPGPMENNLVRFSIPAVTYGALLLIAWSRQREQDLPREKLLVWGFGLGAASSLVMALFVSLQLLQVIERAATYAVMVPLERGLAMASVVVVAGAFLHYILDDLPLTRRFLLVGLGATLMCLILALWQWPRYLAVLTEAHFHASWTAGVFQLFTAPLLIVAILLLQRKRGWLVTVVTIALLLFFASEVLFLANYATDRRYSRTICPIGNSFPLLAIPILGYVYLREQAIDKKRAERDLEAYQRHLEDLVTERTAEIAAVNAQLQDEVRERKQAKEALEQLSHQYELILASAGEGICGLDRQGRFTFVNPAAATLLGYQVGELVGQSCHVVWRDSSPDGSPDAGGKCPVYDAYARGISSRGDDQLFWRKDHTTFPAFYISNPTFENETFTGAVVVFRDITERKRAEAEIAQRNANLAAQNAIAAALSRSLDLETMLGTALDAVLSVAEMKVGLVFLWDDDLDELTLQSYRGPALPDGMAGFERNGGCCKAISTEAMKGLRAVIRAVADEPDPDPAAAFIRANLETLISVPLISKDRALGALTLGSGKSAAIRPGERELLTAIGQQIGVAVENAHLYQAVEQVAERLTLLHQISTVLTSTLSTARLYDQIVEQSVKLLNCQLACILDWNEEAQQARLVSSYGFTEAEAGFLQQQPDPSACLPDLIRCRESIVIGDTQGDPRIPPAWREKLQVRALLCVPLAGMEEPFGALFLMDRQSARRWRSDEVMFVESFVNRAAVALMNAHLVKQLEWTAAVEERQAIAADMHDGLAQTVSLLGLQLDGAMELVTAGSAQKALAELSTMRETVHQVSIAVRRSIASLQRTPQLRRPLQELLSALPEQLAWEDGQSIDLILKIREPLFLPPEQEGQALFIVREALLNAHRHARAQRITVVLGREEQGVRIAVEDDGLGFEPGAWWENSRDHFGLGIMHSRAARMGAKVQIDSAPGQGTRVILTMPLAQGGSGLRALAPSWDDRPHVSARQG